MRVAALARAFVAVAAAVLGGTAAAGSPLADAQQAYQKERAACMNGTSNQDRATCLKEAGAAWQEARRGALATPGDGSLERNRLARCEALPPQDRADCALRMQPDAQSGSARAGGILREAERPVPTR